MVNELLVDDSSRFRIHTDGTFSGNHGRLSIEESMHWESHSHSVWEIILILEGYGFMKVEEKQYAFSPGTIFCIPPNIKHHNQAQPFYNDFCIGLVENLTAGNQICVFKDDENNSFLHLMQVYDYIYHAQPLNFGQILGHLRRAMQALIISWHERQPTQALIFLTDTMNANLSNVDFKVSDAIAKIPLNANYVRKQFRETYGMTPVSYMNLLRITEAKALLLTTRLSISEIALKCGFTDVKYFTRLFHSTTQFAPLEYRKFYEKLQEDAKENGPVE